MEDHRLKSYCLVVETRSFSRAAQAKHMTQSAMSRIVKKLEDELGVKLLNREGKVALPTPEGALFYEHAKKLLESYARLEQDISVIARTARDSLRVGSSRTAAFYLLPQVLYDFSKKYPELRIDLTVSKSENIMRDIRENRIDLGVAEGAGIDFNLPAEAIAEDEVVVIAPENHPLAEKKMLTAQDLLSQVFILPERDSGTRKLVDEFFRQRGLDARRIHVRMTIGNPDFAVQMVKAGLGVAFVSKWSAFTAVKEGTVKVLQMPGKKILRKFYLVYAEREIAYRPAKTFRDFIRHHRFFVPF